MCQSVSVLKDHFWWRKSLERWKDRAGLSFQFLTFSNFRACAMELVPVSPTRAGGRDSGALFTHAGVWWVRWYHPVSLPCCLFGHKPWKRLQPAGIVSQKRYLLVFIRKGRAFGTGSVILCIAHLHLGWQPGRWRSQTERRLCWCMLLAARAP